MKKLLIKVAASALLTMPLSSCSDWLKVEMEDKIMETVLFSNYSGYVSALNGVYMMLNDYYAQGQLMSILDVMAQYYYVSDDNNHTYRLYQSFDFSDISVENKNTTLWNQGYNIIAHTNAILDHLKGIGDTPLNQTQYNILRGECLAMRAMLHFDILRRHGAIYTVNPDAETIPYQDDTSREIKPFLTNKVVMEKIMADLNEAAALLQASDPIITEGIKDTETEDDGVTSYDMSFRQLRLNYYAVQALIARAYLWMGDKTNAYRVAKHEIIEKANTPSLEVFPWVTKEQVEAEGKPDVLFSPEVIFSLYNSRRSNFNNSVFSQTLAMGTRLTFYGESIEDSKVSAMYEYPNDYRRGQWRVAEPQQSNNDDEEQKPTLYFTKFNDFTGGATEATYRYIMPMIRMSEIYLIAAESTNDTNEAIDLINEIRIHRNSPNLEHAVTNVSEALVNEFAGEMVGEGQLYFFYKRRQESTIMSRTGTLDYNMLQSNYVWPIPESEISKRTQIGK